MKSFYNSPLLKKRSFSESQFEEEDIPDTPTLVFDPQEYHQIPDFALPTPLQPRRLELDEFDRHQSWFEGSVPFPEDPNEALYLQHLKALFPAVVIDKNKVINVSSIYTKQFKIFHPYCRKEVNKYLEDQVSTVRTTTEVQGINFDYVELNQDQSISKIRKIIAEGPFPDIELVYYY